MGTKQDFQNFIDGNLDGAYRFAYSYMKNREAAEDVVHDSVVRAIRSLESLRKSDRMKPWFFKIVSRTAQTAIKRSGREQGSDALDWESGGSAEDVHEALDFEDLIQKLPPDYKAVLVLHFFENMSLKAVSEILETNENTVKTRLYRALKLLRLDMEVESEKAAGNEK